MSPLEAPQPFDPIELEKDIVRVRAVFDELDSDANAPIPRKLHDLMQDEVMKIIATLQTQVATLAFYLSAHEDRIADIEEGEVSQLLPEDAVPLVAYLERCAEIFGELKKTQGDKLPGIHQMVSGANQLLEFIHSITLPPEDESGDDDDDMPPN